MCIIALGFHGKAHEPDTSWQFLGNGHRIYSPALMRFHCSDSISPFGKGGINTYTYCSGDPINNTDPSGHFMLPVAALLGLASVGTLGAALVAGVTGNGKELTLLGAIGGALAIATVGMLGLTAMRLAAKVPNPATRLRARVPEPELAPGGVRIWRGSTVDVVRIHGKRYGSQYGKQYLNGEQLAEKILPMGATTSGRLVWAYPGKEFVEAKKKAVMRGPQPIASRPLSGIKAEAAIVRNGT